MTTVSMTCKKCHREVPMDIPDDEAEYAKSLACIFVCVACSFGEPHKAQLGSIGKPKRELAEANLPYSDS